MLRAIHPSPVTLPQSTRSRVISKALRTITPGLMSTSSPFPSARIRFLATAGAEMPLESLNVRSDRSTSRGGVSYLHQGISHASGGHDVQLVTKRHDFAAGNATDGDDELERHGQIISAEGCRWHVARRPISSLLCYSHPMHRRRRIHGMPGPPGWLDGSFQEHCSNVPKRSQLAEPLCCHILNEPRSQWGPGCEYVAIAPKPNQDRQPHECLSRFEMLRRAGSIGPRWQQSWGQ